MRRHGNGNNHAQVSAAAPRSWRGCRGWLPASPSMEELGGDGGGGGNAPAIDGGEATGVMTSLSLESTNNNAGEEEEEEEEEEER